MCGCSTHARSVAHRVVAVCTGMYVRVSQMIDVLAVPPAANACLSASALDFSKLFAYICTNATSYNAMAPHHIIAIH